MDDPHQLHLIPIACHHQVLFHYVYIRSSFLWLLDLQATQSQSGSFHPAGQHLRHFLETCWTANVSSPFVSGLNNHPSSSRRHHRLLTIHLVTWGSTVPFGHFQLSFRYYTVIHRYPAAAPKELDRRSLRLGRTRYTRVNGARLLSGTAIPPPAPPSSNRIFHDYKDRLRE